MNNPNLQSYIAASRAQGMTDEGIRVALMSAGWQEADIVAALLEGTQPLPAKKSHGSASLVIGAIILLAVVGGGAIFAFERTKQAETPAENTIGSNEQATSSSATSSQSGAVATVNPDIERVQVILEEIREGYLAGNKAPLLQHSTVETKNFFSESKSIENADFTVTSVSWVGGQPTSSIVAAIIVTADGKAKPQNLVFTKEDGDWKLDLDASFQYELALSDAKKGTGDPNGLPDIVVTQITMTPMRPIVNDKNFEITAYIKNNGTKTSDEGAPLSFSLIGFDHESPVSGGVLYPITPGETVTWKFKPYELNDVFKITDTAGKKTVQIILDPDKKITESNRENNTFTQEIEVYAN